MIAAIAAARARTVSDVGFVRAVSTRRTRAANVIVPRSAHAGAHIRAARATRGMIRASHTQQLTHAGITRRDWLVSRCMHRTLPRTRSQWQCTRTCCLPLVYDRRPHTQWCRYCRSSCTHRLRWRLCTRRQHTPYTCRHRHSAPQCTRRSSHPCPCPCHSWYDPRRSSHTQGTGSCPGSTLPRTRRHHSSCACTAARVAARGAAIAAARARHRHSLRWRLCTCRHTHIRTLRAANVMLPVLPPVLPLPQCHARAHVTRAAVHHTPHIRAARATRGMIRAAQLTHTGDWLVSR